MYLFYQIFSAERQAKANCKKKKKKKILNGVLWWMNKVIYTWSHLDTELGDDQSPGWGKIGRVAEAGRSAEEMTESWLILGIWGRGDGWLGWSVSVENAARITVADETIWPWKQGRPDFLHRSWWADWMQVRRRVKWSGEWSCAHKVKSVSQRHTEEGGDTEGRHRNTDNMEKY